MTDRHNPTVFEELEPRLFLAGDVTATLVNGVLQITGDAENNTVYVNQVGPDRYLLSDFDGTTNFVGAEGGPLMLEGPLVHVVVDMTQGGDDEVHIGADDDGIGGFAGSENLTIPGNLYIQTGEGDDIVELVAGGEGGEGVAEQSTVIGGKLLIYTNGGADQVAVGAGEVFNLFGPPVGEETFVDASLEVGGAAVINTGTNQVPGDNVAVVSVGGEGGDGFVGAQAAVSFGRNLAIQTLADSSEVIVAAIGGYGTGSVGGDATLDIAGSLGIATGVPLPAGQEPGEHMVGVLSIGGEGTPDGGPFGIGGTARVTVGGHVQTRVTGGEGTVLIEAGGGAGGEGAGGAATLEIGGNATVITDHFDSGIFVGGEGGEGFQTGAGGNGLLDIGGGLGIRTGNGNDDVFVTAWGGYGEDWGIGGSGTVSVGGPINIITGNSPIEDNTDEVFILATGGDGEDDGTGGYANFTVKSSVGVTTGSGRSNVFVGGEGGDDRWDSDGGHAAMDIRGNLVIKGGNNRDQAQGGEGNTVGVFGIGGRGTSGFTGGNGSLSVAGGIGVTLGGPDTNTVFVQAEGGNGDGGTGGDGMVEVGTDVSIKAAGHSVLVLVGGEGGDEGGGYGGGQGGAGMMSVGRSVQVGTFSGGDVVFVNAMGGAANDGDGGDAGLTVGLDVIVDVGNSPLVEGVPNGGPANDNAVVGASGGGGQGYGYGQGGAAFLDVGRNVFMKGGYGLNPQFEISGMDGPNGEPGDVAIGGTANIRTAGTDSNVAVRGIGDFLEDSIGGDLLIRTGGADDEVLVEETHVLGNVGIGTGTGDDMLTIVDTEIDGILQALLYYGNDWFYVENSFAGVGFVSGSAGFDTLETPDVALPPWTFLSFENQIVPDPV